MAVRDTSSKTPTEVDLHAVESQIDALYALPLTEFTAARNALAKTLKGEAAARVKKLEKPAAIAWTTNQLFWHDRASYNKLMAAGRSLREAQVAALSGAAADLKGATAEHRSALSAAVNAATKLAGEHAVKPGADPLARMLETLSLSAEAPAQPGRFVDVVQPAGFEALAGITPVAVFPAAPVSRPRVEPAATTPAAKSAPHSDPAADKQKAEVVAAARKAADHELQQSRRRLEQVQAAEVRLRSQVDAAREHLTRIEAAHRDALADVERAAEALSRAENKRNRI